MGISDLYSNSLRQKGQIFFTDISSNQTIDFNQCNLSEKIKLNVSINQAKKHCTYQINIFEIIGNQKYPLNKSSNCSFLDKTEAKLDLPIIIKYFFEMEQKLLIEVIRTENRIPLKFEIQATLGSIMGSRKNTLKKQISSSENEIIIFQAEKLNQSQNIMNLQLEIYSNNNNIDFSKPKNKIYYEIFSENNLLYRSEFINDEGKFISIKMPVGLFKNNKINIIFYKYNKKEKGNYNLNIYEFSTNKIFNIQINKKTFQIISKSKIKKEYTFIDYLKAGVQIGLAVAIDFTSSNLHPNDENSLHNINKKEPNQYEKAINACGNIVAYYDYDQLFPCFGFGAKYKQNALQIFNLNLKNDPNVKFVQGIIKEYHKAINIVSLYGPTYFTPVIKKMNDLIKGEKNHLKYHILMILTDGMINDINETIDELVESSFLPLSIIIIGVGKADFYSMIELDSDKNPLVNSKGVKAERDLVQFVPFLKYESNPENLAKEVLAEIPRQIIEYYKKSNIDPINYRKSFF